MTPLGGWDYPVLTVDGRVYTECPSCGQDGSHPCEEVDGILMVTCRICGDRFGWRNTTR